MICASCPKMFNFLKTRGILIQNARVISTRSAIRCSTRVCSFCNFYHFRSWRLSSGILLRQYATDIVELQVRLQKKSKHRSKKYIELLEDQAINNRKATVQKVDSAHVSILADEPDFSLDKLHKINNTYLHKKTHMTQIKDIKHIKNMKGKPDDIHYTILKESSEYLEDKSAIVEELKESNVSDHTTLLKDSSFVNTLHQINSNDNKDENQDDSEILAKVSDYHETPKQCTMIPFMKEKDRFEESLSGQNLVSQLLVLMDAYIQNGMENKAFKIMMLKRCHLKRNKIFTVPVYNLLMEAYVCKPHIEKVFEIYKLMNIDSVKPNAQTYSLMFQMIGNMKAQKKQIEILTEVMADMHRVDISFDEVMSMTRMNAVQHDVILQCIRLVAPQYSETHQNFNIMHKCKLLQNLKINSNCQSPAEGLLTIDELLEMMHKQMEMERQHEMEVKSIATFIGDPDVRRQAIERIAEWEKSWRLTVTKAFEQNISYLKQKENRLQSDLKTLYPFLQVLPREEYVNAILREIRRLARSSDVYSDSLLYMYLVLGKYIYKRYEFQRKKNANIIDNIGRIYNKYLEWYLQQNSREKSVNGRIKWQQLVEEARISGICSDIMIPEWPRHILINVGKFLYNIIVNDVKIPYGTKPGAPERHIPAFYLLFRNKTKFLTEEIKPHPHLHRLFSDSHPETLTFDITLLPTCVPPRPWIDIDTGGYLFSKTEFVRDPYIGMGPKHLLKNTPTEQLYPAFDCLNQLGSIPWKINQPILDILLQIFIEGGSEELNVPQPPSALPPLSQLIQNLSEQERDKNKISRLMLQLRRRKNEMYSLWCDCLYKLSLADHFKNIVFWLPHNLDFRGRAYPVPPHLNHLSSDLGRSILVFALGKPLGPKGLDWLKIHTINLTGMKKKEPINKRLEFANQVLELIIDSARNPLTGKMWWMKSDEPWQTLAACKEIDNALQCSNAEEYISRLPIHQDGSCNGLQHYAALGRDQIGAESVNLYPSDMPQDVYSVVASMVDEYRRKDAETGNEIAKVLEGYISRKVIKQTVMTTVYGVTKFGARLQIIRQLSDLKDFNQNYTWSGSVYLVETTFKSLRMMFTSAKEIQDWFTDCARIISTRCNQYVQWVTPLGLPVLQPYYKRARISNNKYHKKPDTLKQKNAFPPNFIHSLDSCHMMLTSLHCEQAGITFMSVHDCFWTHPCSVEIMNKICREQFIALHSEPILEDLSKFLCQRYEVNFAGERRARRRKEDLSMNVFKKLPKKGNFDINVVLSSQYFFN